MKGIYHTSVNRLGIFLLLCFSVVFCLTGVSQATFLDPIDASTLPRRRLGSRPCLRIGTSYLGPEQLGLHGYSFARFEKNGVVYTSKAGFLDITHVRGAIDKTAFLATKTFDRLQKNETEFSFKLAEPSLYFVQLVPPENWKDMSEEEKEVITRDISIKLGQYFAFTACTWHEILTWFGYKGTGFVPEFHSAFSCEDTFSDLLGTHVGVLALQDTEHIFDIGATLALEQELEKLGIQTRNSAISAAKLVKGQWFTGGLVFVNTKKRNFDIGLNDGFITPWIVPEVSEDEEIEVQSYPVPDLGFLSEYGFSLKLEIEPREWERNKILRIIYPDVQERRKRFEPVIHFSSIMDYIKKDAVRRYGHDVGSP